MKYAILYYKKDPFGDNAVSIAVLVQSEDGVKLRFIRNYIERVTKFDENADTFLLEQLPNSLRSEINNERVFLSSPRSTEKVLSTNPNFFKVLASGFKGNIQFDHIESTSIPNVDSALNELSKLYA